MSRRVHKSHNLLGASVPLRLYGPDGLRSVKAAGGATAYYLYDEGGGGTPLLEMGTSGSVTAANGFGGDGWRGRCCPGSS